MSPPEQVRRAVAEVLADPAYDALREGVAARLLSRVRGVVAELLARVLGSDGAGLAAQALALVVPVLLLVLVVVALRRLRRDPDPVALDATDAASGPVELVAAADAAAADGDHDRAVRARYAALVLVLEARGVLEARPGTTVGEVDRAVEVGVPGQAGAVAAAGRVLAGVVYGAEQAGPDDDAQVATALAAVTPRTGVPA